jgi:hypothetical protein
MPTKHTSYNASNDSADNASNDSTADDSAAVLMDLKFIPMTPDEPSDVICTRVIDNIKKFSAQISKLQLYEYKPEPSPEYLTEVMADRKYFLQIAEIVKVLTRQFGGLLTEIKTPGHVIEIFCPNPYGLSLAIANKLFTELKNPTVNMRTIVEYEELWIDYGLRPTVHVFAFLPNSADTGDRRAKTIQLIRPYSIKSVTYIPPEIELIGLYDTYCMTHEEIDDKNLFHMAIKRYKAHLADLLGTGLGPEFKKSIAAQMNALATSGENIPDDDLYAKLSASGRVISQDSQYGGRVVKRSGGQAGGHDAQKKAVPSDCEIKKQMGQKSCGDKKKDLLFQIKVDIVQALAKTTTLFGSWAMPIKQVNHDRVQIMSPHGLNHILDAVKRVASSYNMMGTASATHATCIPKELRLTTTYIKLQDGQREHIIMEYVNTMEYQPMAIVKKTLSIGKVYTLDKYGLLKYIFMNLYALNTVRSNDKIDIKKYINMVYHYCEAALRIRKISAEISGIMGVLVPFAEWRKSTALDSTRHASYSPYEWFAKHKTLK